MTNQLALFDPEPPRDPVRCPRCGWRGEGRELARIEVMSSKPRLLDLFSGAGGCAKGYQQAGFWVRGVDLEPQPRYVGEEFVQADALEYLAGLIESGEIAEFDAIHASPPCQAHTAMRTMWNAKEHPDLIEPARGLLKAATLPYVIENVEGAPLGYSFRLCGTMFGLGVRDAELRRHRVFECSIHAITPPCQHGKVSTIGVYGGHARNRTRTIGIYGEGARDSRRKMDKGVPDFSVEDAREAMGIDWMTLAEMCQAIPPAYTKFIGEQLVRHIRAAKGGELAQIEDEWGACEACPKCREEAIMEG